MADTSTFKRPPPPTSPAVLALGRTLLGDEKAALSPEQERACVFLADDEFERLPLAERRTFWNDVVKRELKRQGATAGAIAGSGIGSGETPAAVALAEVEKAGGPNPQAVAKARERLRGLVVECPACESLTLARFKAEDDTCRVCGELLPVSPEFGQVLDASHVAALLAEDAPAAPAADSPLLAPDPADWQLAPRKHDPGKLLALAKDNLDWDDILAAIRKAEEEGRRKAADEAARKKAEADRQRAEAEARARAEAEARARAEADAARKRAEAEAEAARKKAEAEAEAARQRAEAEARARAEAEARARVEAEARAKAEAEARRKADAEAKRKAEEEALRAYAEAQRKAEEEKKAKELEARRKQEAELAAFAAVQAKAEADKKAREEEDERLRKLEDARLAIGRLTGAEAGKIVRIGDLDPSLKPGQSKRPLCLMAQGKAKLLVPSGSKCSVNDTPALGIVEVKAGDIVKGLFEDEDLAVIDENGELRGVNADPVHVKREDNGSGGPWNYWNEPLKIGASDQCEILLGEPGVDEVHATIATRFGRVVVEDACTEADGLWIEKARVQAFVARPGMTFRLGSKGPVLGIGAGQAEIKAKEEAKAAPAKPARYVRTVLHVEEPNGRASKVFLFARREIRFGRMFSRGDKVENDLVIAPEDDIQTVADKQGSFSLTRDGVTLRLDDKVVPMSLNDEEMKPGQAVALKRRFTIDIGVGITLRGEVYRAPSSAKRAETGLGQLGIEGGHPYECVRMVREDSSGHTYVFLVRQIRIGTGPGDSIQLDDTEVAPGHASLFLARGVLQIVAPREKAKVKVDGEELQTGVPRPLKLGSVVELGDTTLRFEVTSESDFQVES